MLTLECKKLGMNSAKFGAFLAFFFAFCRRMGNNKFLYINKSCDFYSNDSLLIDNLFGPYYLAINRDNKKS